MLLSSAHLQLDFCRLHRENGLQKWIGSTPLHCRQIENASGVVLRCRTDNCWVRSLVFAEPVAAALRTTPEQFSSVAPHGYKRRSVLSLPPPTSVGNLFGGFVCAAMYVRLNHGTIQILVDARRSSMNSDRFLFHSA